MFQDQGGLQEGLFHFLHVILHVGTDARLRAVSTEGEDGVAAEVRVPHEVHVAEGTALSYIEDLETYLLKDVEVQVIDVDQAGNRLVLSARELLKEKERKEKEAQIASIPIGTVMSGTVETLQNYGAFVKLENGLSGLVHVSQISQKRVKNPAAVLNVGDEVQVKVIGIKDGKISLSMKALEEPEEEVVEKVEIPKAEEIGTSLGDLFKNIQL